MLRAVSCNTGSTRFTAVSGLSLLIGMVTLKAPSSWSLWSYKATETPRKFNSSC